MGKPMIWFAALVILVSAELCASTKPGVKVRVTKNGVDYANKIAHDEIVEQLKNLTIPDESGKDGRHISYWLYNVQVINVDPPASSIAIVPEKTGLSWALTGFGISIKAGWRVKYKKGIVHISTHGTVVVKVSDLSVNETMHFDVDDTGRASVASTSCSDSIGSVHMSFHGGTASVVKLFRHTVEKRVRRILQTKICDEVVTAVNDNAEKALANINVTIEFAKKFLLDYRLVTPPAATADYIEIADKGEVYWKEVEEEAPFRPEPIPPWTDNSHMLYIWVSAFTPNSFLYQAHMHEFLQYNLTRDDLPPENRTVLNTTCKLKCIGNLIPQIGKQFPDSTVELGLATQAVPATTLTSEALTADFTFLVIMRARRPDQSLAYLATFNMSLSLDIEPGVKNNNLTGKITNHRFKLLAIVDSAIGTLYKPVLDVLFDGVITLSIIPDLNFMAGIGVQLPVVQGVKFINTNIVLQEGNLVIGTDLDYHVDDTLRFESEQVDTSALLVTKCHTLLQHARVLGMFHVTFNFT